DRTQTAMGSRLLRRWLNRPLRQLEELRRRQQAIASLREQFRHEGFAKLLHAIGDMERILGRLMLRSARARTPVPQRDSLAVLPVLQRLLAKLESHIQGLLAARTSEFPAQNELLCRVLVDNPPVVIRDGGEIAPGFVGELDELRDL